MHAMKDASTVWNCDEVRRDLQTALGTTKWQVVSLSKYSFKFVSSYNKACGCTCVANAVRGI